MSEMCACRGHALRVSGNASTSGDARRKMRSRFSGKRGSAARRSMVGRVGAEAERATEPLLRRPSMPGGPSVVSEAEEKVVEASTPSAPMVNSESQQETGARYVLSGPSPHHIHTHTRTHALTGPPSLGARAQGRCIHALGLPCTRSRATLSECLPTSCCVHQCVSTVLSRWKSSARWRSSSFRTSRSSRSYSRCGF